MKSPPSKPCESVKKRTERKWRNSTPIWMCEYGSLFSWLSFFFLTGANVLKLATKVGLWRMIEGKELRTLHTCLIYMLTFHLTGGQDLFGSLPLFTEHWSSLQGREQFRKKLWWCVGGRLINKNQVYHWGVDNLNFDNVESLKDMRWRFERWPANDEGPTLETRAHVFQTYYGGKI